MKTIIYLALTCLISFGSLYGAINMSNPSAAYGIAFGIWGLFIYGYIKHSRKAANKRFRERIFEEYMRNHSRTNQY
jgi:hypothetical protein